MAVVRLHRLWFGVFFYVMFINVQQTLTAVSPADVELATDVCCSVCVGVLPIMAHDLSQWRFQGGAVVKADSLFPASASVAQLGWCCYFHDCKSLRERWSRMPQCFNRCKCPLLCKEFIIDAWQFYYARSKVVGDIYVCKNNTTAWKWRWRRLVSCREETKDLEKLLLLMSTTNLQQIDDSWKWEYIADGQPNKKSRYVVVTTKLSGIFSSNVA